MYLKDSENVKRVCLDCKSKNRIQQQDHDRRSLQKNKRNQTKNRKNGFSRLVRQKKTKKVGKTCLRLLIKWGETNRVLTNTHTSLTDSTVRVVFSFPSSVSTSELKLGWGQSCRDYGPLDLTRWNEIWRLMGYYCKSSKFSEWKRPPGPRFGPIV